MEKMEISKLELCGFHYSNTIKDLYVIVQANEHAIANILIETSTSIKSVRLFDEFENRKLSICYDDVVLFAGICAELNIVGDGIVQLKLMSATSLLDIKKTKRSFQDCSRTFEQIINDVMQEEMCQVEYNMISYTRKIPYIQYNETNWEFVRRMVAQMEGVIYPEYRKSVPSVKIGLEEDGAVRNVNIQNIISCFDNKFWKQEEGNSRERKDFVYYEILTGDDLDIGNSIIINKQKYIILEKEILTQLGEIIFKYKAGKMPLVKMYKYNNKTFSGLTIQGEVLSVQKETVKVRFLFDKEQKEEDAYNYLWLPETGNIMYLMPQVATKVNIYFKNECEDSAIAVSCIRDNGEVQEQMGKSQNRYLTNETGKQFNMKVDSMGFVKERSIDKLLINDSSDILVETSENITLASSKGIHITSKKLYMETPNEIIIKRITL